MFVGHLGLALAAKRIDPDVSLGWYVGAATTLDLLWPLFLLAGIERVRIVPGAIAFGPLIFESYPWSHSLLMAIVWGGLLAGLARWRGVEPKAVRLIAVLVVSHWLLDVVTHAPDMPLWPGVSPHLGLGLWNSIAGTLVIEGALWIACIALYLRNRRAHNWIGAVAFWSFATVSTILWASGPWAPPPADSRALACLALAGWIIVPWSAWADRLYDFPARPLIGQPPLQI